jgi:alkylation response protein AidB-like acyl-CoA dehydrogenase
MDLSLNDDQIAILDAIDTLAKRYASPPMQDTSFALTSEALDQELAEGGFLDVAFEPDLGTATAALVVERLARLPYTVEAAASALIRPLLGADLPRPLCLVEEGRTRRPVRFLRPGATVLVLGKTRVSAFMAEAQDVRAQAEALYGYPVATLTAGAVDRAKPIDVSPDDLRTRWRVAIAAEGAGLLAAALDSAAAHVTDREQFGRAIATFQAVRHRLAEAQVRANGAYWLAMKAARTLDAGDAALAALHVQQSAGPAAYDFHQFLGAMGVTLEHPLHLWTYRLKALIGELGGRGAQGVAAADAIWG